MSNRTVITRMPAPKITLTPEQKDIVATEIKAGQTMKILAFAGCTKTTTLRAYTMARPKMPFLYMAYNTAAAADARETFPPNVKCSTSHALAYGKFGFRYKNAGKLGFIKPPDIREAAAVSSYPVAKFIIDVLNKFLASADPDIDKQHLVLDKEASLDEFLAKKDDVTVKYLLTKTRLVWKKMQDVNDTSLNMTHDGYLKMFQLSNPVLDYHTIMLDEAHDTNDVVLDIFNKQKCAKIAVGDTHQSIYDFRWAENALDKIPSDIEKRLTGSFRFGDAVSGVANDLLLNMKNEKAKVIGLSKGDAIGLIDERQPYTIIARTNGELFARAVALLERSSRPSFGWVGTREQDNWNPYNHYFFDRIMDIYNLYTNNRGSIKDSYIKKFTSFADFMGIIQDKDAPDIELQARAGVVLKYSHDVPTLISRIVANSINPRQSQISFVTAHRSKGLEFNQVLLTDDFTPLIIPDEVSKLPRLANGDDVNPQEFNLWYVAATRAKKKLQINPKLDTFLKFIKCQ